jgi:putative DNA primase/helicase
VAGIEPRQDVVDAFYRWLFPESEHFPGLSANSGTAAANRDLSDREILYGARQAANGDRFERLYSGDTTDYGSHFEADLALCSMLAFWTGPDPERIERMFSESGLAREKWHERPTYREKTVEKALSGMTEFYHAPSDATLIIGRNKGEASGLEVEPSLGSSPFSKGPSPSPEAPSFPVEALPDAARAFVEGAAEAIGCAVDLIAAPVLAVLSAGIGASRVVEIKKSWREGVTLFIAVVAEPGDKKTPAANAAKRPVMRRQAEQRSEFKVKKAEYERELREWKAECQRARKDGEAEPPPPVEPTMERVYADDTTVEALVVILEMNLRGILDYKDELTGWIGGLDQYKGGKGNDRQFWLSIHTNTPVVVDRKVRQSDPVFLNRPFVTLAGGIQPAMLPKLGGSMEDGLLDRFLFAYPNHSQTDLSEMELEPGTEETFADLYDSLCSLRMVEDVTTGLYLPNVTPMSPEAKRRFKEIHDAIGRESHQAGFPARLRGVWAKMRGYLARISLILALCRCAEGGEVEQVEGEDVENAAVIVAYFRAHARRVYGKLGTVTSDDLLAGELRAFLEDRGGAWKGTAAELYAELEGRDASGLPENEEWLSRKVRAIGDEAERLTVDPGYRGKERILKLGLANTVGTDGKFANGGP